MTLIEAILNALSSLLTEWKAQQDRITSLEARVAAHDKLIANASSTGV